jgi:hypothetical protein
MKRVLILLFVLLAIIVSMSVTFGGLYLACIYFSIGFPGWLLWTLWRICVVLLSIAAIGQSEL